MRSPAPPDHLPAFLLLRLVCLVAVVGAVSFATTRLPQAPARAGMVIDFDWPQAFASTPSGRSLLAFPLNGTLARSRLDEGWAGPRELPGGAERAAYAELKAKAMDGLGERGRQAMLEGRLAPEVVGEASAGELRKSLMDRAVEVVPLLQRLQAEARAARAARERDQVDGATLAAFDAIDGAMQREIDEVKGEAEWLSDQTGQRRGMGEQIWPMAFQVYAQRRAEVARRAESAKAS